MKKIFLGTILLGSMFISCSKDGDEGEEPVSDVYINTATGSTWNYQTVDNSMVGSTPEEYTLTSTNRDTSIEGKTYHIYNNSSSGEQEFNGKSGNDYFIFQALPDELGGSEEHNLYMKAGAAVNATWSQSYDLPVSGFNIVVKMTNKIIEKGISRTVNGVVYNNVIHVKNDISFSGLPPGTVTVTTDIHQYYAPNYGLIEAKSKIDIDALGTVESSDFTTTLKSATLL